MMVLSPTKLIDTRSSLWSFGMPCEILNAIAIFSITPNIPWNKPSVHVKISFIANNDVTEESASLIH